MKSRVKEIKRKEALDTVLRSHRVVVVYFYTEWSGPAKLNRETYNFLAEKITNVKFLVANSETHKTLADVFKIHISPTTIIFKDGKEISRIVNYMTAEKLLSELGVA